MTRANIKAVVSGSAAAALKLKSDESGAGRFTDILLPPLTFYEYLELLNEGDIVTKPNFQTNDIKSLNEKFIYYLNFGGYPEVIFSPQYSPIRHALSRVTLLIRFCCATCQAFTVLVIFRS